MQVVPRLWALGLELAPAGQAIEAVPFAGKLVAAVWPPSGQPVSAWGVQAWPLASPAAPGISPAHTGPDGRIDDSASDECICKAHIELLACKCGQSRGVSSYEAWTCNHDLFPGSVNPVATKAGSTYIY